MISERWSGVAHAAGVVFRDLLVLMMLQAGCGPVAENAESAESEKEMDLATSKQELVTIRDAYHHGGNLWEQTFDIIMGSSCGVGQIRKDYQVWHAGNGNCWSLDWATSEVNDCRVRVRVRNSGGWVYGDCYLNAQAVSIYSCSGHCGGGAPGGCWCDRACAGKKDCCKDYTVYCQ